MELTINTLIKIVLVILVIVVVAAGLIAVWQNYLKPYFSGLGKEVTGIALLMLRQKSLKMRNP
jgi:hypothetical protein